MKKPRERLHRLSDGAPSIVSTVLLLPWGHDFPLPRTFKGYYMIYFFNLNFVYFICVFIIFTFCILVYYFHSCSLLVKALVDWNVSQSVKIKYYIKKNKMNNRNWNCHIHLCPVAYFSINQWMTLPSEGCHLENKGTIFLGFCPWTVPSWNPSLVLLYSWTVPMSF